MKTRHTLTALSVLALAALAWATAPVLAQPGRGGGPPAWDEFAERHDVNGDGQVTEQELFQTFAPFDRLDADGDGVVTEADFDAHRGRMAFTFMARRADRDRDGEVTAAEWDAWFAARDSNGDGVLDAEDFADRRPGMRRPKGDFGQALDADGDGEVTRADLTALAARYDANGDGVLQADELPETGPRHGGRFHHRRPGRR